MLVLKIAAGIVGGFVALFVGVFAIFFVQAFHEGREFQSDCKLMSENPFTHETSWRCTDNVTYFKNESGIITARIGMDRNSKPRF